jgi:putative peptidoglycan lipid II flippase
MIIVGGLTIIVKIVSTLKEIVIAYQFGIGDSLDAFFIAYLLPSFAINVVAGSFVAAFIPTYIKVQEHEGKEAAQRLFSTAMVWSLALLIATSVLLGLAAPYVLPVLGSGFRLEKLALTRSLFFILLPVLTINGVATMCGALLNAGERFAMAAITPVITPVVVVVIVYELGEWGVYAIALAMLVGAVIECTLLAGGVKRAGISLIPSWHVTSPAMKEVVRQYAPLIAGASIMSSTILVNQSMAAMLGAGSVSILNYGNKVTAVVVGISSVALSTATLPQFSRMVAAHRWSEVRHTLKTYTSLILLITIPLTSILILFSTTIVSLLFERGAFTSDETLAVAPVQSLYVLQIPFYLLGILVVRLISASKANHVLMWGAAINFCLNIGLNYLFMQWWGVAGIALSTSVVYMISLCYLSFMLLRFLGMAERENRVGSVHNLELKKDLIANESEPANFDSGI